MDTKKISQLQNYPTVSLPQTKVEQMFCECSTTFYLHVHGMEEIPKSTFIHNVSKMWGVHVYIVNMVQAVMVTSCNIENLPNLHK